MTISIDNSGGGDDEANDDGDDEYDIDDKCEDNTQAGNLEASGTNDARLQFRPFVENRWDCPVCWQTKKCFSTCFYLIQGDVCCEKT